MLLVLWVIRLLNGADITPRGQGVVFHCVIEFCLSPPPLSSFGKRRGRFFCRGWPLGSRSVSSVLVGSHWVFFFFYSSPLRGHHGDPFRKKCAFLQNGRGCVCGHAFSVRALVFVPQPAAALCHAVTCSQISQRIYHPVNCLWVVDKMPPMHPHMKTLWG